MRKAAENARADLGGPAIWPLLDSGGHHQVTGR